MVGAVDVRAGSPGDAQPLAEVLAQLALLGEAQFRVGDDKAGLVRCDVRVLDHDANTVIEGDPRPVRRPGRAASFRDDAAAVGVFDLDNLKRRGAAQRGGDERSLFTWVSVGGDGGPACRHWQTRAYRLSVQIVNRRGEAEVSGHDEDAAGFALRARPPGRFDEQS